MTAARTTDSATKTIARVTAADFLAAAQDPAQLVPPTIGEVAFCGRSNVGKSSLMNCLLARKKLVRTSSTPGCTRQINLFEGRLQDGLAFRFCDLPGYGYAKVSKAEQKAWRPLIESYLRTRVSLRGVIVLVDIRRSFETEEHELLSFVAASARKKQTIPVQVVATKMDKISRSERKARIDAIERESGHRVLGVSAETGDGREALWTWLKKVMLKDEGGET